MNLGKKLFLILMFLPFFLYAEGAQEGPIAQAESDLLNDQEIRETIRDRLKWDMRVNTEDIMKAIDRDISINEDGISVIVNNGTVTLRGNVKSIKVKEEAESIASNTLGVLNVENNLMVEPIIDVEIEKEEELVKDDRDIRQDIIDELFWNTQVDASEISISVENGNVTLNGTVDSLEEENIAISESWTTEGVKSVSSNLEITYDDEISDAVVRSNINNVLFTNSEVDASDIEVSVTAGIVTLGGSVESYWQKKKAQALSEQVTGAIDVNNELAVVPDEDFNDERIADSIIDALDRSIYVEPEDLTVKVENGIVTLIGTVDTWREHEAVYDSAVFTEGVVDIIDNLNVS